MKVFNGVIYYTVTEVAQLCEKSTQIIKIWNKKSDEIEKAGGERLIPPPYIADNGYKYWSAEDTQKIVEYAGQSRKEKYGKLSVSKEKKQRVSSQFIENAPKIKKLSKDFNGNLDDKELLSLLSITRNTLKKYKSILKEGK